MRAVKGAAMETATMKTAGVETGRAAAAPPAAEAARLRAGSEAQT
jgi:hypothetical protein